MLARLLVAVLLAGAGLGCEVTLLGVEDPEAGGFFFLVNVSVLMGGGLVEVLVVVLPLGLASVLATAVPFTGVLLLFGVLVPLLLGVVLRALDAAALLEVGALACLVNPALATGGLLG